jgi:hypothetical protein
MGPVFQAHPIPQNVTNFEFHLVGDMTLKQFGYLALGLGVAFITFIGLASPFPFVAYPIILISAATGAAFAFVPIQERPLDHWVAAFFKAIFQPTKLTYQSKILKKEDPFFSKRLALYIKNKHADQSQKHFQTQPLSIFPFTENFPSKISSMCSRNLLSGMGTFPCSKNIPFFRPFKIRIPSPPNP